ncbi:hypothetical protein [Halolactibacillus sp. JCM 19043]|uniref:hypothetical protein n=1 Tax=Halolactibacillus sp. JCM 19043 TaxID=1460638 RepID=UPI0007805932|nr:hypothetical protein [Halolactibacillus sp. JCM 19043]
MRKIVTALFIGMLILTTLFTLQSLTHVLSVDIDLPTGDTSEDDAKRLVLITDQMGTPFYDAIVKGARAAAFIKGCL